MIAVRARDFIEWRSIARHLLANDVSPDRVVWSHQTSSIFGETELDATPSTVRAAVPKEFLSLAETVSCHSDPRRWALLYQVLYRLTHGERQLLQIEVDDDVRLIRMMDKAVHRDMHKMKAFVRFRKVEGAEPEQFVAWHNPDHQIVDQMGAWFRARFGSMRWSILTPHRSVHWDLETLTYAAGVPRSEAPDGDALEDLWKAYYASIFNPARVKVKAMKTEMPVRHWSTLPEAQLIPSLLAKAGDRVIQMANQQKSSAAPWVPSTKELSILRSAAPKCEGCDLYQHATQVVFGEGPQAAKVVMVGEQPGDEEDIKGKPFVGPAGRLLDKAILEAGIDRQEVYVTNAVKHFKFVERGKRRIHAKPTGIEISSCRPWLEAELASIEPELVICLGATAAQTLMGRDFRVTTDRGKFFPHHWAKELVATIHPSAILRMPEPERREEEYNLFVEDLRLVAARMREMSKAS